MSKLTLKHLHNLLNELKALPNETEWVEFKHNADIEKIGEYISALANSAALLGKPNAYIVFGIDDKTHEVIGTNFKPYLSKHKQQEIESWLLQKLSPKIHFHFYEFTTEETKLSIVILEIQAAEVNPVKFDNIEYIRIGSYKKKLSEFPNKEKDLWRTFDKTPFEKQFASIDNTADEVLKLLDYSSYFNLANIPLPENRNAILEALKADKLIKNTDGGLWNITNLGAVLFANVLNNFERIARKALRVIIYKGNSRTETLKEIDGTDNKGYASGFDRLTHTLENLFLTSETIKQGIRHSASKYPALAIRELVANAIIHQDLSIMGTGPTIEIFDNRIEITNPGTPLVETDRFLDSPPQSRNEALASLMRRINICEERGSGIDKIVSLTEYHQLPAPIFEVTNNHVKSILFSHKEFAKMDKEDRIRACYLHCCLRYVNRETMNNSTLRERFKIDKNNSAMVSRVIKDALEAKLIKIYDTKAGTKAIRYIPKWA